jgi:hypothetical protein
MRGRFRCPTLADSRYHAAGAKPEGQRDKFCGVKRETIWKGCDRECEVGAPGYGRKWVSGRVVGSAVAAAMPGGWPQKSEMGTIRPSAMQKGPRGRVGVVSRKPVFQRLSESYTSRSVRSLPIPETTRSWPHRSGGFQSGRNSPPSSSGHQVLSAK